MNTKIEFPIDLFNPARMPARDENGYAMHPDFFVIFNALGIDDEGESTSKYLKAVGYEFDDFSIEDDAPQAVQDSYFIDGNPDISAWKPIPKQEDGWLLLGIYDHEDGARVCYVRKLQAAVHTNQTIEPIGWITDREDVIQELGTMFITNSHKKSLIAQEQVLGTLFTTPLYTSTTSNMVVPDEVLEKAAKYDAINTPEITDFIKAVENEALHQRERWGSDNDAGKTDADWFWLIGYLAGKAINKPEKMLHHIITTAAACLNWHSARTGNWGGMRPGIDNTIYTAESKENEK